MNPHPPTSELCLVPTFSPSDTKWPVLPCTHLQQFQHTPQGLHVPEREEERAQEELQTSTDTGKARSSPKSLNYIRVGSLAVLVCTQVTLPCPLLPPHISLSSPPCVAGTSSLQRDCSWLPLQSSSLQARNLRYHASHTAGAWCVLGHVQLPVCMRPGQPDSLQPGRLAQSSTLLST